jgi:hypothetical protein
LVRLEKNNIKIRLKEMGMKMLTGVSLSRMGEGRLMLGRHYAFQFNKSRGVFRQLSKSKTFKGNHVSWIGISKYYFSPPVKQKSYLADISPHDKERLPTPL